MSAPPDPFDGDLRAGAEAIWCALIETWVRGAGEFRAALHAVGEDGWRTLIRDYVQRLLQAAGVVPGEGGGRALGRPLGEELERNLPYLGALLEAGSRGEEELRGALDALTVPEALRLVLVIWFDQLGLDAADDEAPGPTEPEA